jgi:hypothetical protein
MKITAVTIMAWSAAFAANSEPLHAPRSATVCMENDASPALSRARMIASKMFAGIGVEIGWRHGLGGCPEQGIRISLILDTPSTIPADILAHAKPYEGNQIRLYYDRILRKHGEFNAPLVLAHVLTHEIAHILQGLSRHSDVGVMKARFGVNDVRDMSRQPLAFTVEDVHLIYAGLAWRATRGAMAFRQTGLSERVGAARSDSFSAAVTEPPDDPEALENGPFHVSGRRPEKVGMAGAP